MNYFSEIFGLITRHDQTTENAGLFLAHYFVLKLILGEPILEHEKLIFLEKMANARVSEGLYRRSKHHTQRTVSHDEITGMLISSKILKTGHGVEVMDYIERHFLNYPATGVAKFYQPSNFYMWGLLTGRRWTAVFYPFYAASFFLSIRKPKIETSSKLIYLIELYTTKDISFSSKVLWTFFVAEMNKVYGKDWIRGLFEIYFNGEHDNFPLLELSRRIGHGVVY